MRKRNLAPYCVFSTSAPYTYFQPCPAAAFAYCRRLSCPRRLAWLHQFQMEAKLLEQLMQLGPRMRASSGSGILSGAQTERSSNQTDRTHSPDTPRL